MDGIELSKSCFFNNFLPLLRDRMPEAEERLSAGLVGAGSECFGYDDGISRDHDFCDSFYIWLTDEDDIKYGVGLSRIYRESVSAPNARSAQPVKRGVTTVRGFYMPYLGSRELPQCALRWLFIPECALAEATNGEIFLDNAGEFSALRRAIRDEIPTDVFKKRLAARLLTMAQSGQYNFSRCLAHGERGAARLALSRFAEAAVSAVFLMNGRHMPYYKWAIRAMGELPMLSELAGSVSALLWETDEKKCACLTEEISASVAAKLRELSLSTSASDYLEPHAYSVFESVEDRELRQLHILEG